MIDVSKLRKGDRLSPIDRVGGPGCWFPFVEVVGPGANGDTVAVLFSDGKYSRSFSPNGWCQFELLSRKPRVLENK